MLVIFLRLQCYLYFNQIMAVNFLFLPNARLSISACSSNSFWCCSISWTSVLSDDGAWTSLSLFFRTFVSSFRWFVSSFRWFVSSFRWFASCRSRFRSSLTSRSSASSRLNSTTCCSSYLWSKETYLGKVCCIIKTVILRAFFIMYFWCKKAWMRIQFWLKTESGALNLKLKFLKVCWMNILDNF